MSFAVNVDPTNPGQFFACCGLLELADRLWPGAEGWFADGMFQVNSGTLAELIAALAQAQITSSLSAAELKRLGTLLSVAEAKLTPTDIEEKTRLKQMWKFERLRLSAPFDIWIDWWRDERGERTDLKTWAAKQLVAGMAQGMLGAIRTAAQAGDPDSKNLFRLAKVDTLPFNIDSDQSAQGSARDTGFSADTLEMASEYSPLLELLAFVGLQRVRPLITMDDTFRFSTWRTPQAIPVVAAVGAGVVVSDDQQLYEFALFNRTKYMKVFLPAQSQRGVT